MRTNFERHLKTEQNPNGSCGCASQNHTRPAHDPGRFPSSLPRRTFLAEVRGRKSEVRGQKSEVWTLAAAVAAVLLSVLPCLATEDGQATTFFDVPAGGVLASLVAAVVSALGTWVAMRGSAQRQRQRQTTKIEGQPLKVEAVPGHTSDPVCEAKHRAIEDKFKDNTSDHDSLFPRVTALEKKVERLEGVNEILIPQLKEIKDMVTILIGRK